LKSGPVCWVHSATFRNNTGLTVGGILVNDGNLSVTESQFCSNLPHISGVWTNGGGNQFADACGPFCVGDADGDAVVNAEDLASVLADWGPCAANPCYSDFNGDGIVNSADLTFVLSEWGRCPGW